MSNYLAKLKIIEREENFDYSPITELTKLTKDTSGSFDSAIQGENKINSYVLDRESIEIKMIRGWLYKIDEPEEDHFLVLDKCRTDPEALEYFYKHANGEFGD